MTKVAIRELVRELIILEKNGTLTNDYKMPNLSHTENAYFCELLEMATFAINTAQSKN
jgi:hypothetical protein